MQNNEFLDKCFRVGDYNNKPIYLYINARSKHPRLFYTPKYYLVPQFIQEPERITLMQAVKIINYRDMRDNIENQKNEDLDIDKLIDQGKNNSE